MTGWTSGAPVVALGLAAAVLARRLPGQAGFGLGPAFLPFWTGVVLAGCGVWLCLMRGGADPAERPDVRGLARAGVGFAVLLLYALALEPLGYLLGTGSFLVGGGLLLDRRRPGRALAIGIGSAGFLLLVFRVWLRVPLPAGVLGW